MFRLDDEQLTKLQTWVDAQDTKIGASKEWLGGACGGILTYIFTPTSLGLVTTVRHNLTKEEINLTDYEGW